MKRITITTLLVLSVCLGHYTLYTAHLENFRYYWSLPLSAAVGCVGLFGAIGLMLQAKGLRLRKICALLIGMVSLASFATMAVYLYKQPAANPAKSILSPAAMLYGNTYAFLFILYPMELMRPGWFSIRRALLLYLPVIVIGAIYFVVFRMQKTAIPDIRQWSDLAAHFRTIELGFRLIFFAYPVWLFVRTFRYKIAYNKWCDNNCSSKENKSLELLNNYNTGFLLILISYIIIIVLNNAQGRILHGLLFLIFIVYLLYQNTFNILPVANEQNSPFYNKKSGEESDVLLAEENLNLKVEQCSFIDKIPQYKEMLEKWLSAEKPYKDPHFKLLDCMSVLPLNRSYLSRLFNEGYNETFFEFVMRHRIDESIRLLNAHPNLTIACISELCGFSSPSVFGRAFLKHKGVTPLQYRKKFAGEVGK